MREALEHPFFGLGKLAGTLSHASEANTVDIKARSKENLTLNSIEAIIWPTYISLVLYYRFSDTLLASLLYGKDRASAMVFMAPREG